MSSSFVEFRGRGFEASDAFLEICLIFFCRAIDAQPSPADWLREARDEWYLHATAGFGFGVMPGFDAIITDESKRGTVLELCRNALEEIDRFPAIIPRQALNALGTGGEGACFLGDVPRADLRRTATYLLKLVEGTLEPWERDARFECRPADGPTTTPSPSERSDTGEDATSTPDPRAAEHGPG